jgi:hypothetical protein
VSGRRDTPFTGGPWIPPARQSEEEADLALRMIVRLAAGDTTAARRVAAALGLIKETA